MSKKKKLEEVSFWPGYVDALVNVVLNILFLVGLMAVGLVTLNFESLGKNNELKLALTLETIKNDTLLLAALGTVENAIEAAVPELKKREAEAAELKKKAAEPPPAPPPPSPAVDVKPKLDVQKVIQIGQVSTTQTRQAETEQLMREGILPTKFWITHQNKRWLTPQELAEIKPKMADGQAKLVLFAFYPENSDRYKEIIFLNMQKIQLGFVREGWGMGRIRLVMKPLATGQSVPGDMVFLWVE